MSYRAGKVQITQNKDGSGSYHDYANMLTIKNDGKGKATVTKGTKSVTVDAAPLGAAPRLPLLGSVPAVPSLEANSLLITLDSGVLFDVDKYDIRPEAQETLNQLAKLLTEAGITALRLMVTRIPMRTMTTTRRFRRNRANSVKGVFEGAGRECGNHDPGLRREPSDRDQ